MSGQDRPSALRANIWKLYADRFFCSFWIIAPLIVPYYVENGLSATQVYSVQAIYSLAALLLDIPTGYLSDVIGRRRTLLLGGLLLPLGMVAYALAHGFWTIVLAELLVASGNSMRIGADTAFLFETLEELGEAQDYKKREGQGNFLERAGSAIASLLSSLAAFVPLRALVWSNVVTAAFLLPLSYVMAEPAVVRANHQKASDHARALFRAVRVIFTSASLRWVALYASTLFAISMISFWSYFLLFGKMGLNLGWYGVIAAAINFAGGFGGKWAFFIEKRIGARLTFFLPLLIAPLLMLLAAFPVIACLPLVFVCSFLRGLSQPLICQAAQDLSPPDQRATTLSVFSAMGRMAYVVLTVPTGWIVDHTSLSTAFVFLAGITLVGAGAALWGLKETPLMHCENKEISCVS